MTGLREKVANSIGEADKWRATDNSPDWQAAEPAWHAYAHLADAAIAICMEEAAKVASGGYPKNEGGEYAYGRLDAAAALRALRGDEGGVDDRT